MSFHPQLSLQGIKEALSWGILLPPSRSCNSFYGVLIYGSYTLVTGRMVQLWGETAQKLLYSLCCPNQWQLCALLMLRVSGWCPTNCCSSGLSDNNNNNLIISEGIQCSRKELAECEDPHFLIQEEYSVDAAQSWCHWRFALQCGDLAMTSASEPFNAARVLQSSDHASKNLGHS